jgi:hypothetical protein
LSTRLDSNTNAPAQFRGCFCCACLERREPVRQDAMPHRLLLKADLALATSAFSSVFAVVVEARNDKKPPRSLRALPLLLSVFQLMLGLACR